MRTGLVLGYKSLDMDVARSVPNTHFAPPYRLTSAQILLSTHVDLFPSLQATTRHYYVLPSTFFWYYRGGSLFLSPIVGCTATSPYLSFNSPQLFNYFGPLVSFFLHRVVVSIYTGISYLTHSKFRSVFEDPVLCSQSKPDINHMTELSWAIFRVCYHLVDTTLITSLGPPSLSHLIH